MISKKIAVCSKLNTIPVQLLSAFDSDSDVEISSRKREDDEAKRNYFCKKSSKNSNFSHFIN